MRSLITTGLLVLVAACASSPNNGEGTASSVLLADALRAQLLHGEQIDLNTDLAAGRPVALVFWQSW